MLNIFIKLLTIKLYQERVHKRLYNQSKMPNHPNTSDITNKYKQK